MQEKENIANYKEKDKDLFNAPSPIRRVFQRLPQISVSELMDMEIDDDLSKKKGIAFLYILNLKFKKKLITFLFTFRRIIVPFL